MQTISDLKNLISSAKCGTDLTIARTMVQWSDVPPPIKALLFQQIVDKRKTL